MGKAKHPPGVKLIVPMFTGDPRLFEIAESRLSEEFGEIDFRSGVLSFDHTNYYAPEFGEGLLRKFVSLRRLVDPGYLPDVKIWTNALEGDFASEGKRRINLDPGYVSLSKVVLATTKDHRHRVYLGKGIYAEVTLFFQQGAFRAWEWTYPDYRTQEYIAIFSEIRRLYALQLRDTSRPPEESGSLSQQEPQG